MAGKKKQQQQQKTKKYKPPTEDYSNVGNNKKLLDAEKRKENQVAIRFIIKEAEYLMKCGRYPQAVSSVNRILNNLPQYGLEINEIFGETMRPHTQVLLFNKF